MEIHAEVTFHIRPEHLHALKAKAREIDLDNVGEEDTPDIYTDGQALQVVWHNEPEWLHNHEVLLGWTIEKIDGAMVWP